MLSKLFKDYDTFENFGKGNTMKSKKYENYALHETFTVDEKVLGAGVQERIRIRRLENGYLYFRDLTVYSNQHDDPTIVSTSTFVPE